MSVRFACLIVALITLPVTAQTPVAPLDIGEQELYPGEGGYSAELAATGAQGSAQVLANIGPENRLVDPRIQISSKSTQLDELAVARVGKLRIKTMPVDNQSQEVTIKVIFVRDTLETILQKTCGEFMTDLAFARGLDATARASDVRGYKLAQGVVMFAKDRSKKELEIMAKNLKAAPQKVEEVCSATPDANFASTLTAVIAAR